MRRSGVHYEKGEVSTPCPASTVLPETPFLTLPTSCPADPSSEPFASTAQAESWTEPGHVVESEYSWSGPLARTARPGGLQRAAVRPVDRGGARNAHRQHPHGAGREREVAAEQRRSNPTPKDKAEADVRDTTVTLPEGVQVNPSAANGLQACPEHGSEVSPGIIAGGIGFTGFEDFQPGAPTATFSEGFDLTPPTEPKSGESYCPEASKLGTVRIKTPLLPKELEGAIYLAEPAPNGEGDKNPFDSLIAMYIVAEDHEAGILVKLAGEGELNQSTGRVSTTFKSTPQLPFEELKVELFGGQRASLSTPASCGTYSTVASFTPWSVPLGAPATLAGSPGEEFDDHRRLQHRHAAVLPLVAEGGDQRSGGHVHAVYAADRASRRRPGIEVLLAGAPPGPGGGACVGPVVPGTGGRGRNVRGNEP